MARMGTPLCKISAGARGLPGSGTDAGPPDRIAALLEPRERLAGLRKRVDFAIDTRLAHAPRDQLRDLRAEVDDENEVMTHPAPLAQRAPRRNGARPRSTAPFRVTPDSGSRGAPQGPP